MAMTTRVIGTITSPTVVPLSLRENSISSSRSSLVNNYYIVPYNYKSKLYTRRLHVKNANSDQFFNSRVDEKLVKVLEYEIKSMEGRTSLFECTKSQMPVLPPADFPFSIDEESRGDGSIVKFKRELHGEHIEVCVCEPISVLTSVSVTHDDDTPILRNVYERHYPKCYDIRPLTDYDILYDTDDDDDDKYLSDKEIRVVPLLVKITKKDATFMSMRVFGSADVIFINHVDMIRMPSSHDAGSSFEVHSSTQEEGSASLSDDLQYSMKEFMEARGINKTNAEFWLKFSEEYHKYHREFDFLKAFKHYITHGT